MTNPTPDALVERRFLLMKRGLFYAPDNCGYTGIKDKAGRYLESDALPASGVTAIHEDDAPEFSPACFDDLARAHLQSKIAAIQERIERLESALEPFARVADHTRRVPAGAGVSVNVDRLRDARTALGRGE